MKLLFCILFVFITLLNAGSLVKLHVSKNHTFLTFIESISGATYVSKVPKQIYLSQYKNDIKNFVLLHKRIAKSTIKKYPHTKKLLKALYIESLNYKTFREFERKIKSYKVGIGTKNLDKYFRYLHKLYPRFEKILWKKTYKGLLYRKDRLEKLMQKKEFDMMIKKVLDFYSVDQKDIGVLDIALYPISYGKNIKAYSMGNIETIGIFVGQSQNLVWLLSATILHELAHSIYRKSTIVQKNFLNIKNKKRARTINEVMATAIGAGWGYNALTNRYAKRLWYNNKTYNRFGKRVYPKIKKYIETQKSIDLDFVRYIKELL